MSIRFRRFNLYRFFQFDTLYYRKLYDKDMLRIRIKNNQDWKYFGQKNETLLYDKFYNIWIKIKIIIFREE